MEIRKVIIVKILIVLISFFLIDGGRSVLVVGNNIQLLLSHSHSDDIEIPHQNNLIDFTSDEKYLEPVKIDFLPCHRDLIRYSFEIHIASQEFSETFWQPPKSV